MLKLLLHNWCVLHCVCARTQGVFIVMSYGWGWLVDGDRPDVGDIVGACLALAGVCMCWFWPRKAHSR